MNSYYAQPATFCNDYPILNYLLSLRSELAEVVVDKYMDANQTGVVLGPQDGLEDNHKYVYTVTAVNSIGTASSSEQKNMSYLCK